MWMLLKLVNFKFDFFGAEGYFTLAYHANTLRVSPSVRPLRASAETSHTVNYV